MMTTILSVNHLTKTIQKKTILSDISFDIQAGDCVALIGPNGAGKSTLMSCLLGDKKASKGSIRLYNQSPTATALRARTAFLPQENQVPAKLTVAELIQFFQEIADTPLSTEQIDRYLGFTAEQKKQFASKLSGGQKRLLSFVLCLIGQADILFLDEPTAGMDTSTRQHFWKMIAQLKAQGKTIIYSSHYIEEVEHTAERILVLHKGKLLRDTTPFAMRSEEQEKQLTLPKHHLAFLETRADAYDLELKGDVLYCKTKNLENLWPALQAQGCQISDIEVQNKTLLNTLFDQTQEENK